MQIPILWRNRKRRQDLPPYLYRAMHSRTMANPKLQNLCPKTATRNKVRVGAWLPEYPTMYHRIPLYPFHIHINSVPQLATVRKHLLAWSKMASPRVASQKGYQHPFGIAPPSCVSMHLVQKHIQSKYRCKLQGFCRQRPWN